MKKSTFVLIIVILLVGGGWYWYTNTQSVPPRETSTTEQMPIVSNVGERCGGNMTNAPICALGSHCAPNPDSHLPFGDVGGTCVLDNPAQYVEGNLLLGTDATTTLGKYLIAYNGMTLYMYTKDTAGVSNCSGECALKWPPYVVAATSSLSNIQAGINGKVGAITRSDGSLQVTYNGKPLYFWVNDKVSGDTLGQNVGGVWFVVKP